MNADALPPITSVFDCDKVEVDKGNNRWTCGWCGSSFRPIHATRALYHVIKDKKLGIKGCKAAIPPRYAARYSILAARAAAKKAKNKRIKEGITDFVETRAEGAAALAISKKLKISTDEEHSLQVNNAPSIASFITRTPSTITKSSPMSSSQPSIDAAFSRNYQQDVRDANKVVFEMAVADFFTATTFLTAWLSPQDLHDY